MKSCGKPTITSTTIQERHDNNEIESHNDEYLLLYKVAEILTSNLGRFLKCQKCYILLVTCALVIYLICMPSALGHTYQANSSCPCYNYYMCIQNSKIFCTSNFGFMRLNFQIHCYLVITTKGKQKTTIYVTR